MFFVFDNNYSCVCGLVVWINDSRWKFCGVVDINSIVDFQNRHVLFVLYRVTLRLFALEKVLNMLR